MKEIIFLHPDLGLGGAERLVVDAAIALSNEKYNVSIVTSYHDENHCFHETKDGTLRVDVVGEWIPRSIFGRFFALFAYLKMVYCALYILLCRSPDMVFCDLVSACIPILKLRPRKLVVMFYCHFPDQLLSQKGGFLKQLYRLPLNWLEEKTTGQADVIFVNSGFTKTVFQKTFTSLNVEPTILYPSVNVRPFTETSRTQLLESSFIFLSVNRYEKKKHVDIAIRALKYMNQSLTAEEMRRIKLYIAGGYDPRVEENLCYFAELNDLVTELNLHEQVDFFKSPPDGEKYNLIRNCDCLIYTPPNEHFGIVPLEAMHMGKPVIACNSGGPTETIAHNTTGLLCEFNPEAFAEAMVRIFRDEPFRKSLGQEGMKRFENKFSFAAFSQQLSREVRLSVG